MECVAELVGTILASAAKTALGCSNEDLHCDVSGVLSSCWPACTAPKEDEPSEAESCNGAAVLSTGSGASLLCSWLPDNCNSSGFFHNSELFIKIERGSLVQSVEFINRHWHVLNWNNHVIG